SLTASERASVGPRSRGMPFGASYRARQVGHARSRSGERQIGHASSSSRSAATAGISEDRVDERRERLDAGSGDQQQAGGAEEDNQGNQPTLTGLAAPNADGKLADRRYRAAQHHQAPPELSSLANHATDSSSRAGATAERL